jgi:hypothetical protein
VLIKSGLQYQFANDALNNNEVICYGLRALERPAPDEEKPKEDSGAPTFSAIYRDIIAATGCAGSALCHAGEAGKLQMKDVAGAFKALVNTKAMGMNADGQGGNNCKDSGMQRVVPGKPDDSLLVKKLEGTQPCGDPMPIAGKLSDEKIKQVRDWIADGAKDN